MLIVLFILIILVSIVLALVVLVQNSKGGGLVSNFSSSNQFMGVRKTTDFLEKATWSLAVVLLALSLLSAYVKPHEEVRQGKVTTEEVIPTPEPELPANFPAQDTTQ